jgi:hypothetical protein
MFEFIIAQEQGGIVGAMLMIPWSEWSPTNTRLQESDSLTCGSHIGEQCAMELPTCITIRDYNPYRVRRALGSLGYRPPREVKGSKDWWESSLKDLE